MISLIIAWPWRSRTDSWRRTAPAPAAATRSTKGHTSTWTSTLSQVDAKYLLKSIWLDCHLISSNFSKESLECVKNLLHFFYNNQSYFLIKLLCFSVCSSGPAPRHLGFLTESVCLERSEEELEEEERQKRSSAQPQRTRRMSGRKRSMSRSADLLFF